jgi:sorting nexin-4
MESNFDDVDWSRDDDEESVDDFAHHTAAKSSSLNGGSGGAGSSSSQEPLQAGPNADALDLAGVGRGKLETFVTDPQTEGEGTKDAYVSYLVTTEVNAHRGISCARERANGV